MVDGNPVVTLLELERLTQGIQHMHKQLVYLSETVKGRDSGALERVQNYLDDFVRRAPQGYPLEIAFLQLLLDAEAKEKRISELMGETLRLGDNRVEASKDDYYFAQMLTGVFRKVENWVYCTFENAPGIGQHLGDEAENSFFEVAGDRWREVLEKEHVLLFTRVVMMELVKNVLEPRLLGINNDYLKLIIPAIEESLLRSIHELPLLVFAEFKQLTLFTDKDEDVKWRTKTIDILSRNKLFWETFKSPAHALATKLFTKFSQCTEKKPARRIKTLASLIQATGVAAAECQTQPSEFQFEWLPHGSKYIPELASDANNKLGDEELKDKRRMWVVVMTVTPAILRVEHGSGKQVVVVKARVLLEERSPLRGEGSQEESWDDRSSQDTRSEDDESSEEEDRASDEDDGSCNEDDRGGEGEGGGSGGEDGNRGAIIEQRGECEEEATENIDVNAGNEEHSVSEEQGTMTELARNRENNRETEDIEDERTSEATGSYEEIVRREADWSREERKEEENPERKRAQGEIDKQNAVEEGRNFENAGSHEEEGVKEVEDHEAGISHVEDKVLVDTKVTRDREGGGAGDEGSSGMEGNKQTVDHEARKISLGGKTSVDNRKFEGVTDERGDGGSVEEGGNRDTIIEQGGQCGEEVTVNLGNGGHGVSEGQGIITEFARIRENNRETEVIENEGTSEATASYEEGARREAGWSGDGPNEEENPEKKRTEGEIDEQGLVEEGENSENEGSHDVEGVKEVEDHEAVISHGGDTTQVDTEGGGIDDEVSSVVEGNKQTVDHGARKIGLGGETSADNRRFKNVTEERGNFDNGGSLEVEGAQEVVDHEAEISHGGDKTGVDTKGGHVDDEGTSFMEGNIHEARKINSGGEASVDNRNFKGATEERGVFDNDSSHGLAGAKEVADHEAGVSHGGDKTQADTGVTGDKKGGNVDDKGGEEGSTQIAGRETEISPPGGSEDGMKYHDATEKSEKGENSEDQDSHREKQGYARPDLDNAEQGANFEDKAVMAEGSGGVVRGEGEKMIEEGGFEENCRSCGEEESKAEISRAEDTESCEKDTICVTNYEEDKGTEEEEKSDTV